MSPAAAGRARRAARGRVPALANCASLKAVAPAPAKERMPAKGAERAVPEEPRVGVAAGGTAGHVVPAMAVAEELRASGALVSWLGARERIEGELGPAGGFEIDFVQVRGIDRRHP